MGAVTFSLDRKLLTALRQKLEINTLIETGTYEGDTVEEFRDSFSRIYSIELSDGLYAAAKERFSEAKNIQMVHGDSATQLAGLKKNYQGRSTLFWLDAHWCVGTGTSGITSQCPLMNELKSIGSLDAQSVILIDDARLFLAPPLHPHEISQWPSFDSIVRQLLTMSHTHQLMVVNDVIAFVPHQATESVNEYAQRHGIDWLQAAHAYRQYPEIIDELNKKEVVIKELAEYRDYAMEALKPPTADPGDQEK